MLGWSIQVIFCKIDGSHVSQDIITVLIVFFYFFFKHPNSKNVVSSSTSCSLSESCSSFFLKCCNHSAVSKPVWVARQMGLSKWNVPMTVCYYIYKMSHLVSSVIFQEENVSRSNLSQSYRFVSLSDHLKKEDQHLFLKGNRLSVFHGDVSM